MRLACFHIMERLLGDIVRLGAHYAIMDLTGVDIVDTNAASHLLNMIGAIRLFGAEAIITGIRPNVAQTMVSLGIDMSWMITLADLRKGIEYCMKSLAAAGKAPRGKDARDDRFGNLKPASCAIISPRRNLEPDKACANAPLCFSIGRVTMTSSPSLIGRVLARTSFPAIYADLRDYFVNTSGKTLVGLILCPILVTLTIRLGTQLEARDLLARFTPAKLDPLYHWYVIFALQFSLLYVIPVFCVKVVFREQLAEYGHQIRPLRDLWPLLLVFVAVMLPITYASSLKPSFSTYYPLYRGALDSWRQFFLFETGFLIVFFTQEFFFRGFLIEVLKPKFGMNAILIASAMYGIAHYTKPLPEQLGAFFVGLVLGYIGDRYRTFYFGVIIHYLISLSMDVFLTVPVLLQK